MKRSAYSLPVLTKRQPVLSEEIQTSTSECGPSRKRKRSVSPKILSIPKRHSKEFTGKKRSRGKQSQAVEKSIVSPEQPAKKKTCSEERIAKKDLLCNTGEESEPEGEEGNCGGTLTDDRLKKAKRSGRVKGKEPLVVLPGSAKGNSDNKGKPIAGSKGKSTRKGKGKQARNGTSKKIVSASSSKATMASPE